MALFLLLIILLAIAWGLADYQLQSRIERAPPPVPVPKAAPAASRNVDVVPPAESARLVAQSPAAESAEPAAVPESANPRQDPGTAPPEPDKTAQ